MIDAYRVGVHIALSGNVAKIVGDLAGQFKTLDAVINNTKSSVTELAGAMRGLTTEGRQAASAWRDAAAAMTQAALARRAAPGSPRLPAAPPRPCLARLLAVPRQARLSQVT